MKQASFAFFLTLTTMAQADVRLPAIFGTDMVLQEGAKIPIWGWADPGEAVTVTLGTQSAKAIADAQGKWRVDLAPIPSTSVPGKLTVTGKNTVTFDNVLIGDVWLASGQSNMEFTLAPSHYSGASNGATAVAHANDSQLRLFVVAHRVSPQPETDVRGKWQVCTPESVKDFSAVGYFFGQDLRQTLQRPIGLIGSYWGGKQAQAFTSLSGLKKNPPFAGYVAQAEKFATAYAGSPQAYAAAEADFKTKVAEWDKNDAAAYKAGMNDWKKAVAAAVQAGQPKPPKPTTLVARPAWSGIQSSDATSIFNGMIAPLIPYGIKGVIWYQGESNAGKAAEYKTLFPRMISDWREKWDEGDFPFLFVQLAAVGPPQSEPSEGGWAELRETQLEALSLPDTGMAIAIDVGNSKTVHPRDKLDVGRRLALAARHVAYGQDLVYSGPIYDSMKVEGHSIRLSFTHVGDGLQFAAPPAMADDQPVSAPSGLTGFAIAGADRKFEWATARIDGKSVVVSSAQVPTPVAVRYGWASNPPCDLDNKERLPASPFRTDDWPLPPPTKPGHVARRAPKPAAETEPDADASKN